jgi:hypothetical protein
MLLAMLMIGCEDATPNWDVLSAFGPPEAVVAVSTPVEQPSDVVDALIEAEGGLQDSLSESPDTETDVADVVPDVLDGDAGTDFDNPWGPNAGDGSSTADAPAVQQTANPVTAVMPQVGSGPSGAAFGLPTSVAWGVRLLGTISNAQPPRAALGLPDGTEVVVTPGSMLPSVGMVVITVGANSVQVARVSPAGDHAEIEMVNLVAQYSTTAGAGL